MQGATASGRWSPGPGRRRRRAMSAGRVALGSRAVGNCPFCGAPYPPGATHCASCGQPVPASAPAKPDRTMKVMVTVAVAGGCLLLAIAIGGIVAALAIPHFVNSLGKAKQKRTVAERRSLATALESDRAP